jgi:hypothetical protein
VFCQQHEIVAVSISLKKFLVVNLLSWYLSYGVLSSEEIYMWHFSYWQSGKVVLKIKNVKLCVAKSWRRY